MNKNEHIGPKIKSITNTLNQHLCKDGQELNLTSAQMHVLKYLCSHRHDTIYQKDILNEFELSNATVSGIISRLESKGFVTCCYSDSDSRCKQIITTEKALNCDKTIRKNIKQIESKMVEGFSDEDIQKLHQYLDRIFQNLTSQTLKFLYKFTLLGGNYD